MATSTIDAVPTSPNANSYATVAEATQYFDDRLASSGWTGASTTEKSQILLEATRRIDSFRFFERKYRTNPEQALEFPRSDSDVKSGAATGTVSTTTLADSGLVGLEQYPDDHFIGWAIEMRSGDNEFEIRTVTDFVRSTGVLTFDAFASTVAEGDSYRLIEKVPDLVKYALYETALWLVNGAEAEGDVDPNVKSHSIGKFSETFVDGHGSEVRLPKKAVAYLRKYISRLGEIA